MSPMMYLIMNGVSLAIYFMGSILISKALLADKITLFSNMVIFSSYAMQVIMSFLMLAMIFIMYPRASISADRINEVLSTKQNQNGKVKNQKKQAHQNLKMLVLNIQIQMNQFQKIYHLKQIKVKLLLLQVQLEVEKVRLLT